MKYVAFAAYVAAVCGCGSKASTGAIKIGALVSLSGGCASGSDEIVDAIQLAIGEINAAGGVNGKQLTLVTRDDQSTPDGAAAAATYLADTEKVTVVIGDMCSGETEAAARVLSQKQIVQISPISTSPAITNISWDDAQGKVPNDGGYLFRTSPSDNYQANLLAKLATDKGFTKLAIAYIDDADNGTYGEGLNTALSAAFTAKGGTVLASVALPASATPPPSYTATVTALLAHGRPDALAFIGFPGDIPFFQDFGSSGTNGAPIYLLFTDSLKQADSVAAAKQLTSFSFTADNNLGTTVGSSNLAKYTTRFQAKYGTGLTPDMSSGAPQAYDATYLAALAMVAAGDTTGPAIRDHLAAVSSGGTAFGPDQTKDVLAAVKAGTDVNYEGVSGPVDFDSNGDVGGLYDVYQISNYSTCQSSDRSCGFSILQPAVSP